MEMITTILLQTYHETELKALVLFALFTELALPFFIYLT